MSNTKTSPSRVLKAAEVVNRRLGTIVIIAAIIGIIAGAAVTVATTAPTTTQTGVIVSEPRVTAGRETIASVQLGGQTETFTVPPRSMKGDTVFLQIKDNGQQGEVLTLGRITLASFLGLLSGIIAALLVFLVLEPVRRFRV